jgi:glyoxylate reductase
VTRLLPKSAMDRIFVSCDAKVWEGELPPPRETLLESLKDVEGLLCLVTDKIDSEVMDKAPKLKIISNMAVGYDNIDVAEATRRKIIVTNTPGILTDTTADFALGLMIAGARRIVEGDKFVRSGGWKTWGPMTLLGQDIRGATLGIIGLGRIGMAVARRAKGFDMKLIYYSPSRNKVAEKELGLEYAESLDTLLSRSDFITIHANLTEQTRHLIGSREFKLMKKNCVLVNTARGPIVDNMALFEALRDKKIAAACLDVTDPEPLPSDHPLLSLDNVVVTPHIASASVETRTKMAETAVDNLLAGLSGKVPPYVVNPEAIVSLGVR